MNTNIKRVSLWFQRVGLQFKNWFVRLALFTQIVLTLAVAALVVTIFILAGNKTTVADVDTLPKAVDLVSVGDLSNDNSPIPLSGVVTSVSEATIRSESSGGLTRVNKKLGDKVYAGETIASFENSGERASVQQAEGQYESAKAARDLAVANKDITLVNGQTTNTNITDNKTSALNTITTTYTTLDDVVRAKTDIAFDSPRFSNVRLKLAVPDSVLQNRIENERIQIEAMLINRQAKNSTLSINSDLMTELNLLQNDVQLVKIYLDDLASAYAKALPNDSFPQGQIDAQKSVVSGARSTISGSLSSISGAKIALTNSVASQDVAVKTSSNTQYSIASADASVKTALGSYNAALSRLSKTIIRSPITGTLNSLTIKTGDFVNQGTQVAVVSNNGALEVQAFVSEDDAKRIGVGSNAFINSTIKGVVTRIASALDPSTKKIEVKIGILDENSELINGQSVRVGISGQLNNIVATQTTNKVPEIIKIPLSAVKITPRGSYVFTLSATSSLMSVNVETGTLLGEEIQITSGLTSEMQIIKDARGLKEGQVVTVNTK